MCPQQCECPQRWGEISATLGEMSATVGEMSATLGEMSATVGEMSATVGEISATVGEMSATVGEMSATLGEMSATVGEISATVGEMSATVGEMSATVGEISATLGEMSATVGEMSATVGEMSATVGEMSATVGEMSSTLRKLNMFFGNFRLEIFIHNFDRLPIRVHGIPCNKIPLGFEKISFRIESILWDMTTYEKNVYLRLRVLYTNRSFCSATSYTDTGTSKTVQVFWSSSNIKTRHARLFLEGCKMQYHCNNPDTIHPGMTKTGLVSL